MSKAVLLPFSPHEPWLAPLAGYSDLAFRLLCRENGAAVCCTEMISAKGLIYKNPGTTELLRTHPLDAPLVVQLFGSEPDSVARAMEILLGMGFRYFDLNMGCAVPKVTRGGSGAALLRDIPKALAVAGAMFALAEPGHAGCKLRLGWENEDAAWRVLAPALADAGAGWLTLHPRSARQGFTGSADWKFFSELAALLSIPLIASGDLLKAEDGARCLAAGGPSCVMYARGALRDPAIFNAHRALLAGCVPTAPSPQDLRRRIERHAALARACGRRGE
ncbi:MAG: tRNA-dihydrouridine synthase family protein, partial [Deltaproteobacteria bacterium]|nr:tRNA-dihydrouridine synthase family protein [Deltaproteobacteria bacterium]